MSDQHLDLTLRWVARRCLWSDIAVVALFEVMQDDPVLTHSGRDTIRRSLSHELEGGDALGAALEVDD